MKKDYEKLIKDMDDAAFAALYADSPCAAFAALYAAAPTSLQHFLNDRIAEVMYVELPKLSYAMKNGPTILREDMLTVRETFDAALEVASVEEKEVLRDITATIADAARDIADSIDKAVRRVLLDDKDANRHAAYDLPAHHARLVRCLADIALSASDHRMIEENCNAAKSN